MPASSIFLPFGDDRNESASAWRWPFPVRRSRAISNGMKTGTAPVASTIDALTAAHFVEHLYPSLAWEAAVRLGDVLVASRLVERALQRAWHERDRFATADALVRHAQDAARDAIELEAERRGDVMRVDGVEGSTLSGDVHLISAEAVRRRLDRPSALPPAPAVVSDRPAPRPEPVVGDLPPSVDSAPPPRPVERPSTPRNLATVDAASATIVSPPIPPRPAPTAPIPQPAPTARPAQSAPAMQAAAVLAPALPAAPRSGTPPRPAAPATPPAVATSAPSAPAGRIGRWRAVSQAREGSATHQRPHLKSASIIAQAEGSRLSPRALGAIGAGVALAALTWVISSSSGPDEAPLAALTSPLSGPTSNTGHARSAELSLPDGSAARLGADATAQASDSFGDGVRALTITGPVALSLLVNEDRPVAIGIGTQRWVTAGGTMAFVQELGRTLVTVDSGSLELVSDTARARVDAGQAMTLDAAGAMTPLDEPARDAAFAWRRGRLHLRDIPPLLLRERALQWFDIDLLFRGGLSPAAVMSLNIPLGAPDSLVAAIAAAGWGNAERRGREVTISVPSRAAPPARRASRPRIPASFTVPVPRSVVIP
jgi:hypothetical protein